MATQALPIDPEAKAQIDVLAPIFGIDPDNVGAVSVDYQTRRVTFDLIGGANGRVAFEIRPAGKESSHHAYDGQAWCQHYATVGKCSEAACHNASGGTA